jgi:hypothetical protein
LCFVSPVLVSCVFKVTLFLSLTFTKFAFSINSYWVVFGMLELLGIKCQKWSEWVCVTVQSDL